ncbi:MAG: xylose isomerase [Verrucomicrobia bacterium]|nr:xylose isomerase [Verrucomicrobiota bacterium]
MADFFDVPQIQFEGPKSRNPLAFKQYNPEEIVGGKTMREHLRFASPFWHTMRGTGADPFGAGTMQMPWDDGSDSIENALRRVDVFFEFLNKCQIDFYCWHDRDIAPERDTIQESHAALDEVVNYLEKLQAEHGKKLLWGTACLFGHPRYGQGAATSPYLDVYAYAAAQVRKALECTNRLGGEGYVFWGGREGYSTLINTNMKKELDHLGAFLHMAVDYKKEIGFQGPFYIEPKPQEPTTHQYDSDAAACLNFLREYGLMEHFKLNLETNHATLAGHTMQHELRVAADAGALGSVDANDGTANCGWDTDEFPTDLYLTSSVMYEVLRAGGFTTGGLNFDAKRRRDSFQPVDLFHAHIAGMDTFARGLKIAHAIIEDGRLDEFVTQRYASWNGDLGKKVESGKASLAELEAYAIKKGEPTVQSGRQEMLEALVNQFI